MNTEYATTNEAEDDESKADVTFKSDESVTRTLKSEFTKDRHFQHERN